MNIADVLGRSAARTAALPGSPGLGPAPGRARKLDKALADSETWELVDAAVQCAGDGPAWPYAVILGPQTVTVRLAARAVPPSSRQQPAPPEPWHAVDGGWEISRDSLAQAEVPERRGRAYTSGGYAALGSRGAEIVFVDLAMAPGVLTVDGDRRAATDLVSSLIAQIGAAGVHRTGGDASVVDLSEVEVEVEAVAGEGSEDSGSLTFVVYTDPDVETAARLHQAVRRRPWLRVIVLGDTRGSRWSLTVSAEGVVSAAELGLSAACLGLPLSIPRRPSPSPAVAAAQPDPEPASTTGAAPEEAFSIEDHPGLAPLPPRDPDLGLEPFTAAALHAPMGARGR